eukprot:6128477-Amphidinium_carterae.1
MYFLTPRPEDVPRLCSCSGYVTLLSLIIEVALVRSPALFWDRSGTPREVWGEAASLFVFVGLLRSQAH